jgi:glycosyltransferase involved in cell wall biosynthesis
MIFSPSQWIYEEMNSIFPSSRNFLMPWFDNQGSCPIPVRPEKSEIVNIAVLGATGIHKGLEEVIEAARIARRKNFKVVFHLFGDIPKEYKIEADGWGVKCWGYIPRVRLGVFLKNYGISALWLCSNVQETFSFALTDGLYAGLPIVAKDGGAYRERLVTRPLTWFYENNTPLEEILSFMHNGFIIDSHSRHISEAQTLNQPIIRMQNLREFESEFTDLNELYWLCMLTGL